MLGDETTIWYPLGKCFFKPPCPLSKNPINGENSAQKLGKKKMSKSVSDYSKTKKKKSCMDH